MPIRPSRHRPHVSMNNQLHTYGFIRKYRAGIKEEHNKTNNSLFPAWRVFQVIKDHRSPEPLLGSEARIWGTTMAPQVLWRSFYRRDRKESDIRGNVMHMIPWFRFGLYCTPWHSWAALHDSCFLSMEGREKVRLWVQFRTVSEYYINNYESLSPNLHLTTLFHLVRST